MVQLIHKIKLKPDMICSLLYDNDNDMFVVCLILRGTVKLENLMFSIQCMHPKWKIWNEG